MNSKYCISSLPWFLISVLVVLSIIFPVNLLLPEPAIADETAFPASPLYGMQITYEIRSGATVTDTKDSGGASPSRTLKGKLGSGQLLIMGQAIVSPGCSGRVTWTASGACGAKTDKSYGTLDCRPSGTNEHPFSISIPIYTDAASGSFSITMSDGSREITISGTFERELEDKGTGVSSSTAATEDPPPGPLIDKLPDVDMKSQNLQLIERVEGNPIYVSADPHEVPPSQRKWVKIMPGDYTQNNYIFIDANWTVRTPSGAETVMRTKTGCLWNLKERTWYENTVYRMTWADNVKMTKAMMGGIWHGISNFYFPKGGAEAKKWEIALERAHVGIKGTNFVVEVTEQTDVVKVIEGTVEVTFDETGDSKTLEAGQQISATESGLGSISSFNIQAEKAKWSSFYQELGDGSAVGEAGTQKKLPFSISSIKCPLKAAYQCNDNPQLALFRQFRDRVLLASAPGRELVNIYYTYGPIMATLLDGNEMLRYLVRSCIVEPIYFALDQSRPFWNLYAIN